MRMSPIQIAEIAHEANRKYCQLLGDNSQPRWADAPQWQKDSALVGVEAIQSGRVQKPSDSHESWLKQKEVDGWSYGPLKDLERKEHPCFVPYDKLPQEQKMKDYIFFSVVSALLEMN